MEVLMVCYVIGEPEFEASNWYKEIVDGLLYEKKQKRFTIVFCSSVSEFDNYTTDCDDFVFVIGNDSEWISEITHKLYGRFKNRVIVLGNHERGYSGGYSVVTSDIGANVKMLCEYLASLGRRDIAMYGVNRASVSDAYKEAAFRSVMGDSAEVFYNDGSLENCFKAFSCTQKRSDAIICVNIYAAISLIKNCRSKEMLVTSLGGGALAEFVKPTVTHIESDYRAFAGVGLELARILIKDSSVSSLTAYVKGCFKLGESTEKIAYRGKVSFTERTGTRGDIKFYSDKDVREMLLIEQMLSRLDESDLEMLYDIIAGKTYQYIADKRFCSEGTVKYKMKNLYDICGVKGRAELVSLLDKYLK
jgi:DNA-binding LacI/PurR family transcriptional regulator/DNA-binding CsgD family transcriptional regulator